MDRTLKQVREELKMTQIEAAELFGISRRSYQSYENEEKYQDSIKYNYMLEKLLDLFKDENKRVLSIEEIKSGCENVFSKYEISYCYLFGSYAKGKAREDSDVDLLIATDLSGLKFFGLVEELRTVLRKNVDVLELSQLKDNKELLNEILKDGVKIYG